MNSIVMVWKKANNQGKSSLHTLARVCLWEDVNSLSKLSYEFKRGGTCETGLGLE